MPNFGVEPETGTLSICKAKPENRGRGNCPHGEHVELTGALSEPALIARFNEEKLAEHFGAMPPGLTKTTEVGSGGIRAVPNGAALTPREFDEATEGIADAFPEGSWELLNSFYSNFDNIIRDEESHRRTAQETRDRITAYLDSDDPVAQRVRDYLGPEISTATFSAILVNEIRGMTARIDFRSGNNRDSTRRVVLTTVANDMTKQRYVASVLFFAGRCCYCNVAMTKRSGPSSGPVDPTQATGEHITALNPQGKNSPIGATRYGNMATACRRCNDDRGNQELEPWLKKVQYIDPATKDHSLARIRAFRRFALYEEYNSKQKEILENGIKFMAAERKAAGGDVGRVRTRFKGFVYDLQEDLQRASS